ncbi:MAG: hypothetical protein KUG79_09375 [Pseudomonadales bacterium]|nr:hypothetical protein [Pseudomonadales bacterium]
MQHIVFLIAVSDTIEDGNYLRLANELYARGHQIDICFLESLAMHNSQVVADGFRMQQALSQAAPFPTSSTLPLQPSDLAWVLSLGQRQCFLDKVQLLRCLQQHCRVINSIDAIMHLKSKYFLASHKDIFKYPPTYASTNAEHLFQTISTLGGQWIAKPPAGSLGRDIFLLEKDDPNTRVILESMTGPEGNQYCLLQPYVSEIQQGEKRVLIAGGEPVGQYIRHANKDHRTNIMHGAKIESCSLSDNEQQYCMKIGRFLKSFGAEFVGLDLAYPYVIEFNVINPGGLQTIESIGGENLAASIIDKILY